MFIKFLNRPISPHLAIYMPQISSLFSIWHRLSGVIWMGYLLIIVCAPKIYFWVFSIQVINFMVLFNAVHKLLSIKFILGLILFYHMLNGLRHVRWDLGYTLENKNLIKSITLFSGFLFFLEALYIKNF